MERRRPPTRASEKATPLPPDYLRLVENVFSTNFEKELGRIGGAATPVFKAGGGLYPNEVVLWIALVQPERLAATTVHASCDFDLGDESAADAEARLAASVDAIGIVFSELLAPEALPKLRIGSQATLGDMPVGWSQTKVRDRGIYLMVDSSNPELDSMAEDWLAKHDAGSDEGDDDDPPPDEPREDPAKRTHRSSGGPAKRKKPPATQH